MPHYLALTILFMLPEVHYKNKLYQSNPILYSFSYPTSEKACFKKIPQTSRFYLTGTEFSKVFTELNRISIMPLQKIQLRGKKNKNLLIVHGYSSSCEGSDLLSNSMEQNQSKPECYFILSKFYVKNILRKPWIK